MEFYLNSVNVEEIREIYGWGILDGVTINPTMLAACDDFRTTLDTIRNTVPVKLFVQVVSHTTDEIVREAEKLHSLADNIVVKIHTNVAGIAAMARLKASTNVPVCATAVHSVIEALAAAKAGADHIAVFLGLLGEVEERPVWEIIQDIVKTFTGASVPSRVMTAGRSLQQIVEGFKAGAHEMTCSYPIWKRFLSNAHTRDRWNAFSSDWTAAFGQVTWLSE